MHEVPEEREWERKKRAAILAITKDTSIPWQEKNARILEIQQQLYSPRDDEVKEAQPRSKVVSTMIEKILANDRKVKSVRLDGVPLTVEDQKDLFGALANNSRVHTLSLVSCNIGNEGAAELVAALRENSTLTDINLEDNQITSNAALDFIAALSNDNETVQNLNLTDNKVRTGLLGQLSRLLDQRR